MSKATVVDPCRRAALRAADDLIDQLHRLRDRLDDGNPADPAAIAGVLIESGKLRKKLGTLLDDLAPTLIEGQE